MESSVSRGYGGLSYPITQVSLVVRDLDAVMEKYWKVFGWGGWDVYDHRLPVHHNTELRGEQVPYSLRGAEVMVGSLNFELLQPLEGPSLWREFLDSKGEGPCSLAIMFHALADSEVVKQEFASRGMPVNMRANIGDHIEYYYMDTEEQFGVLLESGSGHAKDYVQPAFTYPTPDAPPTEKPEGLEYTVTQVSVVVRDLEKRMQMYHEAFGWGPWKLFQGDGKEIMHDCEIDGAPCDFFNVRWAETMVGDLNFELLQPVSGDNPWQRILDTKGEGIGSVAVMFDTEEESERVRAQFAELGCGVTAVGRIGDQIEWYYLDTEPGFKCLIESGSGHALDYMEPLEVYP